MSSPRYGKGGSKFDGVEVNTADSFRGREGTVVLFVLVINWHQGWLCLGSPLDLRRAYPTQGWAAQDLLSLLSIFIWTVSV